MSTIVLVATCSASESRENIGWIWGVISTGVGSAPRWLVVKDGPPDLSP
jgi:hypothetical protein